MEATQPVEKPLSERIKATRKALGLSRVKAAKKWSISPQRSAPGRSRSAIQAGSTLRGLPGYLAGWNGEDYDERGIIETSLGLRLAKHGESDFSARQLRHNWPA